MNEERYDVISQELVKLFQLSSQIYADGVLGLETYTTFNDLINNEEKLLNFKKNAEKEMGEIIDKLSKSQKNDKEKIEEIIQDKDNKQSLSKIRLISVYQSMPNVVIDTIFTFLIDRVVIQIYEECRDFINYYHEYEEEIRQILFEYDFLENIKVQKDFFEHKLQKHWRNAIKPNYWINKNHIYKFLESYIVNKDILGKSYVLEPIVSAIIKLISPIAQHREMNLDKIIEIGIKKFDNIYSLDNDDNGSNSYDVLHTSLDYSDKQLVEDAIKKVESIITMEINHIREKNISNKNKDTIIFLCFLGRKYINYFYRQNKSFSPELKDNTYNLFDRQDVFEIIYQSHSSVNKTLDLFPTWNLRIPVTDISFIEECQEIQKKNKVPYCLLPRVVDLSFWCSPVRDQGRLNSCTAFAATSLFEYFVNRNFNENVSASPLFLYNAARKKMNITEDVGASIRETIKVMALYGVPPEESWSYEETKVNEEPPPYTYAYAQNYQALKYFLLDYAGISKESLLFQIKAVLAAGFPCIFGFTVYTSVYEESNELGHISFPDADKDSVVGGHTVVAVGYDDYKLIKCANRKEDSKGAFLIRNSWGTEWGINGYGWIPYDYVLAGLTAAWWSLLKSEWFKGNKFGAAGSGGGSSPEVTGQPT
ncbi:C1 family peptidase [Calothrix rhizosoleniae]